MQLAGACFLTVLLVLSSPAGTAIAGKYVHNGGIGECDSCHTVHSGNLRLLSASDAGSTCLKCHASLPIGRIVTVTGTNGIQDVQITPAGDFAWLKICSLRTGLSSPERILTCGDRHGHNIIAADFGYVEDPEKPLAPGGVFPSSRLSCISCHNPHSRHQRVDNAGTKMMTGKPIVASGTGGLNATEDHPVGVYRLLGGTGYDSFGGHIFVYPPPDAVAVSNGLDTSVAYGRGMSEWCGNCHPKFLQNVYVSGLPGQMHPAGSAARLTAEVVRNYNSDIKYRSNPLTAYSPIVPVEEGIADYAVLTQHAITAQIGYLVDTRANVICLTCHRAHASPWKSALRWYYGQYPAHQSFPEAVSNKGSGDSGRDIHNGSPLKYDLFRGMFCNKCHAKD